jgi:hypothetical protein
LPWEVWGYDIMHVEMKKMRFDREDFLLVSTRDNFFKALEH